MMITKPIPPTARLHSDIHPLLQSLQKKMGKSVDIIVIRAIENLYRQEIHERAVHEANNKEGVSALQ
jgi:hypothetical protein